MSKKKGNLEDPHNFAHVSSGTAGKAVDLSTFNKVINFCLYALVLLVPLFFLPITSEVLEFNKQALLFFLTVLMLGAWTIKILTTRRVSWIKTPLDFVLLGYLVVYLITSLTSIDRVSSFLGYYGRFTGSFVLILTLVVLYFLVVNNFKRVRSFERLVAYLSWGIGLVLVYSLLQIFGVYVLPWTVTHAVGFNPIGSLAALGIFAALSVVFFQWRLWAHEGGKFKTTVLWLLTLAGLAVLLLINAFAAWLVLALSMIAFLALSMASQKESDPNAAAGFWKPMLVLVVAVLFVAFNFLPAALNPRNLITTNLPVEIQLSNSTTWNLVGNSLKRGAKTGLLGSGPGTTGIAFGDIKPESLNKTIVWSLNFDRGSSEIATIIIETGAIGLLVFELASIMFLVYGLMYLAKRPEGVGWKFAFGFFMLWLALYVSHFFYFFSTTAEFLYWLSMALFIASAHMREAGDEASVAAVGPRSTLTWMFASILMLAVLLVGVFFEAAVYVADASYRLGLNELSQPNPNFAAVSADFARAVTLNPYRDTYLLAYGQNLIFQASVEAAKDQPNTAQIESWLTDLITVGKRATEISPAKAANWSALAQFYTGIRPLAPGTDQFIIDAWQKAIDHDPKNPALYVQLAQAYSNASEIIDPTIAAGTGPDSDQDGLPDSKEQQLGSNPNNSDTNANGVSDGDEVKAGFNPAGTGRLSAAQLAQFTRIDQAELAKAETALNTAVGLKADLPDTYIALARVLEKSNKLSDAKTELDNAAKMFPNNADVIYEQGRITFNQKNYADAETIFKRVIALAPNYANAYYSMGLIYQQRGDTANALAQFQKTREITGPNVDLDKAINDLKAQLGQQ